MRMQFENIGGNSRETIYSLYDFTKNPDGDSIMSIEFNHETSQWSFLYTYENLMNKEHMEALYELVNSLLKK